LKTASSDCGDSDFKHLRLEMDRLEKTRLRPESGFSHRGLRRRGEPRLENDYRQAYAVDVDRILHSRAYTRYIDKTQVFALISHDHIAHRVLHVQLVSKIARTIGRFLRLNEDLIEAIALGHDIGHPPFGHDGEQILSGICQRHGIGTFHHNVQSVRFLDGVEKGGAGWNLCLQTLDGILCHDGEVHDRRLTPRQARRFGDLARRMREKETATATALIPMTLEGCVVRMADTIGYVGRDIEDAIRLGLIQRGDLPQKATAILGDTNGTIVYRLVTDMITASRGKPYITMSPDLSRALFHLKAFNLERIYRNPAIKTHLPAVTRRFQALFDTYLDDLRRENRASVIFSGFLADMTQDYLDRHSHPEIVRDFMAGMTDRYFLDQGPEGGEYEVTRPRVGR
jgi:dGTPase